MSSLPRRPRATLADSTSRTRTHHCAAMDSYAQGILMLDILYHVEEQEVTYWRTAVDAPDAETARAAVTSGTGIGEVIGKTVADRRVCNVHPVTDRCVEHGCYDIDHEEREGL